MNELKISALLSKLEFDIPEDAIKFLIKIIIDNSYDASLVFEYQKNLGRFFTSENPNYSKYKDVGGILIRWDDDKFGEKPIFAISFKTLIEEMLKQELEFDKALLDEKGHNLGEEDFISNYKYNLNCIKEDFEQIMCSAKQMGENFKTELETLKPRD